MTRHFYIRDRSHHRLYKRSVHLHRYNLSDSGHCTIPVSYTHLDVYKRQLKYNRARQGSITQELTEIIAGASAISG